MSHEKSTKYRGWIPAKFMTSPLSLYHDAL